MASGRSWMNICSECGRHVEILNGDVEFSMELHKQSHKSLDMINKGMDINMMNNQEKVENTSKIDLNYCHDCKTNIEVINNDLNLSFQLHTQKHKAYKNSVDDLSDHSSTSSGKSKTVNSKSKGKVEAQSQLSSILGAIFQTMPVGLGAHRGFIAEKGSAKAFCNLCEVTIEPIFSVSDHLKTKLHEDNTIQVIKSRLPSELHDHMEFVSFYGSNLCCNLCRCKIDLCSDNLYETAVNIFAHNAGKGHMSKRANSNNKDQYDKTVVILKSLSLVSPAVKENQDLIEHSMHPNFKCKLCDKQIAYSDNEKELVNNFTCHFNSAGHIRSLGAMSLLKEWKELNIVGKENHNFIVSKQTIYCSTCKSVIETNREQLFIHVINNSAPHKKVQSEPFTWSQTTNASSSMGDNFKSKTENPINNVRYPSDTVTSVPQDQNNEFPTNFKRLVRSLPVQFQKMITQNKKGEAMCSVCNCTIPSTTYNLMTHLNGSSHKKKENEVKLPERKVSSQSANNVRMPQGQGVAANFNKESNLLSSNPPLAVRNDVITKYDGENKYICLLCGTIIQGDFNSLQMNILSHIRSQGHMNKEQLKEEMAQMLPKHKDGIVRELFDLIPFSFQNDIRFIKAPEGANFVYCTICCLKISKHCRPLQEHLEGGYHESSIERFNKIQNKSAIGNKQDDGEALFQEVLKNNKEIKNNSRYLIRTNDDYICKLCKSIMKNAYEIRLLEGNIMSHITGKKHKKNVEDEFNNMLDKLQLCSDAIKVNRQFLRRKDDKVFCTLCPCQMPLSDNVDALRHNLDVHLNGTGHVKKRTVGESPTSACVQQPDAVASSSSRQVLEVFLKLPPSFRGDLQYIVKSSIEGYLSCILCNSLIDPLFLKEHLEKLQHIQARVHAGAPEFLRDASMNKF